MHFPILTKDLALRIAKSEADHFLSWLSMIQSEPGNPFGVEIERFGRVVAMVNADASLGPLFNRALCFGEKESDHLDEIVNFYTERGVRCRIDINPNDCNPTLLSRLDQAGLRPFRFHNFLYGIPVFPQEQPAGVREIVAREATREELPIWAEVWQEGYAESLGVTPEVHKEVARCVTQLHGQPGWRLYLAFVEDAPAAAGALYAQDGVASLLIGATLPKYRRRGCQQALLRKRISDAADLGCDLVAAQAAVGSTSQHNMERAGMRIAFTRAFWLQR